MGRITDGLIALFGEPEPERSTDLAQTLSLDQLIQSFFTFNGNAYPVLNQTLGSQATQEIGADFSGLVEGAYRSNGVVFACMMVRQLLFQEARFQFRRFKSGRPGDYFGTTDLLPLEQPYPNATTGDLLARAIQDVDLAGNWYGARIGEGIRRLRPDCVYIVMGSKRDPDHAAVAADSEVIGYVYDPPSGQTEVFHPGELAHFAPYPDPTANFRGMSWLTPVISEIMADQAATTHKLKFFEQGATPNMVVTFDPAVDAEKVAKWIEMMEDKIGGAANAYRTLYLGGGADAKVVGANMREIGFKDVQGAGETRIAAAAGVPPVVVGLSEGLQAATYSNYSQARRRFADGTMRPLWRNFAGSVSSIIRIPRQSELWYDDRDIPFLREDESERATIQSTQATAIKTLVDAGYDPDTVIDAIDAGDWNRLQHSGLTSVQLLPPGQSSQPKALPALPAPEQKGGIELHHYGHHLRSKHTHPPGERDLRAIADRYALAEAEVRAELELALDDLSDRPKDNALEALDALRDEDPESAVNTAYAESFDHALEEKALGGDPVGDLATSLASKLSEAIDRAQEGVRKAFSQVTEDNLDEMEGEAVTGFVDEAGRAWPIGAYAGMTIATLGRRATSRGVKDAVGEGFVQFSEHGSDHPICSELEGQVFPATDAPEPPIHEGCQHMLIPVAA